MKLLAVNHKYHDYALCMYDSNTGWFQYVCMERELDVKHVGGANWPDGNIVNEARRILLEFDFHPDAVASSTGCYENLNKPFPRSIRPLYKENAEWSELDNTVGEFHLAKKMWVDHHYAHILSGWLSNGTDFDYGVAVDGAGTGGATSLIVENPFVNPKTIYENRYKNFWTASFGGVFNSIGKAMGMEGLNQDLAGKVMGAHAYGNPSKSILNSVDYNNLIETIHEFVQDEIDLFQGKRKFDNPEWLDWLATMHQIWEATLEQLIAGNVDAHASMIMSGGVIQNTVFNERLLRQFKKAQFVPHCSDAGLCIGVMYQMCRSYNQPLPRVSGYPYLQRDEVVERPSKKTIETIASMLSNNKIVGWHQGMGEIGPRALGNRSILMNPAIPNGKATLNDKVKHREVWRPYAASVLEEHAREWFETETPSPYMMRAIPVKESKRGIIPAVVHEDGTCRIQTVTREQNPAFYDLISEFHKLTGIPMLLNTSLNVGGKPISGHPDRSIALLRSSEMDALCVGDNITL